MSSASSDRMQGLARLTVIIGSTRPGRSGAAIGQWFAGRARRYGRFDVEVADLAAVNLPMLDEPNPRRRPYVHQHTRDWSAVIDRADAVVFVTPEYHHGYPATVKNAIDFLYHEWADKPVGFVSYGGISAGTRSVAQLKPVLSAVGMVPVIDMVNIPFVTQLFDANGRLKANSTMDRAAETMLDELLRLHRLLRTAAPRLLPSFPDAETRPHRAVAAAELPARRRSRRSRTARDDRGPGGTVSLFTAPCGKRDVMSERQPMVLLVHGALADKSG